jgi:3-isopropylmalate/(R)-2-methylmalate dehydratase small subunit
MNDLRRVSVEGKAVSLPGNDIDTDRIIPARYLKCVTFDGLGGRAFEDDRKQTAEEGRTHPFDDPAFARATILLTGKNFGCGSSREHAPQALMRWNSGIRAIVGRSFAEIFFGNCVTLGIICVTAEEQTLARLMDANRADPDLSFRVDLSEMTVRFGGDEVPVSIPEGPRRQLMEGRWDPTQELLEAGEEIARTAAALPYFNNFR